MGEGGNPFADRIIELEFALLVQQEGGGGGDGLGERVDAENRIGRHGPLGFPVGKAVGLKVENPAVAGDEGDGADEATLGEGLGDGGFDEFGEGR